MDAHVWTYGRTDEWMHSFIAVSTFFGLVLILIFILALFGQQVVRGRAAGGRGGCMHDWD